MDLSSIAEASDQSEFNDNDDEMQYKKLQIENRKLVEKNSEITSQMNVLKEQFDQALNMTADLDSEFAKFNKTYKELLETKVLNEELKHRLESSSKTINDLKSRINSLETTTDDMGKLKQAHEENINLREELNTAKTNFKSIFKLASKYFQTTVKDIGGLTECLSKGNKYQGKIQELEESTERYKNLYLNEQRRNSMISAQSSYVQFPQMNEFSGNIQPQRSTAELSQYGMDRRSHANRVSIQEQQSMDFDISSSVFEETEFNEKIKEKVRTLKKKYQQKKEDFIKLKKENKKQQNEMREVDDKLRKLSDERDKLLKLTTQQNSLTHSLETKIESAECKNRDLEKEISSLKSQLTKLKGNDVFPEVPLAAFSCPELPEDLTILVDDIAKNESLQTPTKIRHTISVIAQWFNSRSERLEKEAKEKDSSMQMMHKRIDTLVEMIHNLFPDGSTNYETILESQQVREILKANVNKLKTELSNTKESLKQQENSFNELLFLLEAQTITDGKAAIVKLHTDISDLHKEMSNLSSNHQTEIQKINQNFAAKEEEFHSKVELLNNQIAELSRENGEMTAKTQESERETNEIQQKMAELEKKIEQMKEENNNQIKVIEEMKERHIEEIKKTEEQNQTKLQEVNETSDNKLSDSLNEIKDLKEKLTKSDENATALKKYILKMKKKSRSTGTTSELQIQELNLKIKALKKKIRNERQGSEAKLNQLMLKLKDDQISIKNLVDEMDELKRKITEYEVENNQLMLRIKKVETTKYQIIQDKEREWKTQQSQLVTRINSMEVEHKRKIEKIKSQEENSKRLTLDSIIRNLWPYVDKPVDERNLDIAILSIRRKFEEMRNREMRIRGILSVLPDQSIEEVITEKLFAKRKRH